MFVALIAVFLATGTLVALDDGALKQTLSRLSEEILSIEAPTIREHAGSKTAFPNTPKKSAISAMSYIKDFAI